ncbi:hypothetical protein IVB33_23390 [Bradyrhizobium sp. 24]|uniref:hypothetical protein n=1 Tax=unclassified Bradyrhizobium TaxID=2631580 RepID=UPI001FF900E4|nr:MULTISPECIES: hypothetical protein [unclassified Bradyrhizobium]MCK1301214.1 hypothetical protein [Bradyrhizobium sp. 37]MCK1380206.1 hypothetical protein [Bradyrhizobium sp. 24]MCK1774208.1 hypothetical protein [Bradyrhizobium sp. 134]
MSAIRIAIILSLMTPVFTGKVAAQNVGQSDLCALEARSTATMAAANAQTQAEENPLRRSELGQAANKIANDVIRARLDFFGTKYSGTIFIMVSPRSPAIDQGGTMYWIKVVALKNKIGADGDAQATTPRSQRPQLDSPQGPIGGKSCSGPCSYCDTRTGVCLVDQN